ncbi:MAG: 2-C-methyl-D-erythritol 4-phosphate cytidylyltransferase [Oscillospiraceae bacterium]|jgi:2-C-methyl-D-erythritol 4-phosphate cytidylyltransferase|nr:2-C-methyl-D-erythritol 4-phosphate cytidylyltransferase [Oscillospiraceae bacterium]
MAKKERLQIVNAVIAAAGSGSRMDGTDKLFINAGPEELPLIVYTLRAFENCPLVRDVIVAAPLERVADVCAYAGEYKLSKVKCVTAGGNSRTESVQKGLAELSGDTDYVVIHDGARPLVTPSLIAAVILDGTTYGAAIAAVPITDTVKHVLSGSVSRTVPRRTLYAAQTPQVFELGLIKAALYNAAQKGLELTDDAQAVEALGFPVRITASSRANIKVTYPEDLIALNAYLESEYKL